MILKFLYKNHEGKTEIRRVRPKNIWFGVTQWHNDKNQWFLTAECLSRKQERDFAMDWILPKGHYEHFKKVMEKQTADIAYMMEWAEAGLVGANDSEAEQKIEQIKKDYGIA